jgi:hypothetical protein
MSSIADAAYLGNSYGQTYNSAGQFDVLNTTLLDVAGNIVVDGKINGVATNESLTGFISAADLIALTANGANSRAFRTTSDATDISGSGAFSALTEEQRSTLLVLPPNAVPIQAILCKTGSTNFVAGALSGVANALLASITTNPAVANASIAADPTLAIAAGETTSSGSGSGIAFSFTQGTGAVGQVVTAITVTTIGSGYAAGDTITVPQATMTAKFAAVDGAATASSDLVITLLSNDFVDPLPDINVAGTYNPATSSAASSDLGEIYADQTLANLNSGTPLLVNNSPGSADLGDIGVAGLTGDNVVTISTSSTTGFYNATDGLKIHISYIIVPSATKFLSDTY